MKTQVKLLVVIGSQRMNGNSYYLTKTVLDSLPVSYKTIQLAEKNIGFCTLCEHCKDGSDCNLQDDFNDILKEMRSALHMCTICGFSMRRVQNHGRTITFLADHL